ncbi:MAG: glycosyltransferase family 4 protein [Actinomycetes bacterium]
MSQADGWDEEQRKLRVGLVCPYDWAVPGGVRSHIHDLALALQALGHEVNVLAPADDEAELPGWVTSGGRPVPIPYNGAVSRITFGLGATSRVRRWLREGEFDVLHVHEPIAPSLSVIACWAARGPIVATFHAAIPRSRVLLFAAAALQTALEKITARIAVSEHARRTIVEHVGGDAVLIPNGVDCARFAGTRTVGDQPTLLFLGRVDEPRKGLAVLLAALPAILEIHPDLKVVVAGPGDLDSALGDLDPRLVECVQRAGVLTEVEKVGAYLGADLYIAPHTGQESFGIVLLEAMAAGTPVIASDIDAFRRVLDDGRAGELFPMGDSSALAAAVIGLLGDPRRAELLRLAGVDRAQEFDWSSVARDIERVYRSVIVSRIKVSEDLRGQIVGRWGPTAKEPK